MEAFPVGSHVVIELADERKIAGFIVGGDVREGVVLNATHRDVERIFVVGPMTSASIAQQLKTKNQLWLRTSMLARGHFAGVLAGRDEIERQLQFDAEQDILSQQEEGFDFKELASPIITYINPGAINTMERSEDIMKERELTVSAMEFDATLDDTLELILTEGDENDEREETGEDPVVDGREGRTEAGSAD